MDTATLVRTLSEGLKGIYTANEARKRLNLKPVEGGDQVLSQQQNFSLEALAKRDQKPDPFASAPAPMPPAPKPAGPGAEEDEPDEAPAKFAAALVKRLEAMELECA
jgi:phage portal protein BeeE